MPARVQKALILPSACDYRTMTPECQHAGWWLQRGGTLKAGSVWDPREPAGVVGCAAPQPVQAKGSSLAADTDSESGSMLGGTVRVAPVSGARGRLAVAEVGSDDCVPVRALWAADDTQTTSMPSGVVGRVWARFASYKSPSPRKNRSCHDGWRVVFDQQVIIRFRLNTLQYVMAHRLHTCGSARTIPNQCSLQQVASTRRLLSTSPPVLRTFV